MINEQLHFKNEVKDIKVIIPFILIYSLLVGCSTIDENNNKLIEEMKIIATQHLKEEYGIDFVVDRYKFLPKHVDPNIIFYGHSKATPTTSYTVSVDYEDKSIAYVSYNEHKDDQ